MKLARAAYARILIIPHSVSVEHRADQWIIFFQIRYMTQSESPFLFSNKVKTGAESSLI